METIVISTILVNICIGCFACVGLTTASGPSTLPLNASVFLVS